MFLRLLKIINWFLTRKKNPPIVDEPTSEKIIMTATTEDIVAHVREWSLDRAANKNISKADSRAILAEFCEWIDPEDDELEIVSLEPKS
jgi:hypothetical protein